MGGGIDDKQEKENSIGTLITEYGVLMVRDNNKIVAKIKICCIIITHKCI